MRISDAHKYLKELLKLKDFGKSPNEIGEYLILVLSLFETYIFISTFKLTSPTYHLLEKKEKKKVQSYSSRSFLPLIVVVPAFFFIEMLSF